MTTIMGMLGHLFGSADEQVASLRRETTIIVGSVLTLTGFVAILLTPARTGESWGGTSALMFTFFVEGLASLALLASHPAAARAILAVGPPLSLAIILRLSPAPVLPFLAGLIVLANFAIGSASGFTAAVCSSLALLTSYSDRGLFVPAVIFVWASAGLAWLSLRSFNTALDWSRSSQQQAAELLAIQRRHQGELNQTLNALTEATRRLQRVNRELSMARQEAEEARSLKEQFVANVSHELRTPLNLVVGFAEMMYLDPEGYSGVVWAPDLVGDIGELYHAGRHLQSLVDDILDLSRIDAARFPLYRELQPLDPIIQDVVQTVDPLLEQQHLFCRVECPSPAPIVFVDRTRMRQVLLNLLNNAIRFTNRGGITIAVTSDEQEMTVAVQDTGVGIPTEQLGKLFERFHQVEAGLRSRRGAGLGLALSRQFVELHGGRMWAESTVGQGSTFSFSLPMPGHAPSPGQLRRTATAPHKVTSDAPIIVVDPDFSIAEMLGRYLGDRGVVAVRTPDEVAGIIVKERPAGIVLNQAPGSFGDSWPGNGGELVERDSVPVVRCSIPSQSWLAHSAGIDDCLSKPVTREMLAHVLENHPLPGTILVVDDDAGFVSLMERMLRALQFSGEILAAYDGREALRLTRENRPELILLDLLLPGLDGFGVIKALREQGAVESSPRVVAVTATSYAEESLHRYGGHLEISRSGGIPSGTIVELLNTVFEHLHPEYPS